MGSITVCHGGYSDVGYRHGLQGPTIRDRGIGRMASRRCPTRLGTVAVFRRSEGSRAARRVARREKMLDVKSEFSGGAGPDWPSAQATDEGCSLEQAQAPKAREWSCASIFCFHSCLQVSVHLSVENASRSISHYAFCICAGLA